MVSVLHIYTGQCVTHLQWSVCYTFTLVSVLHIYTGQCVTHLQCKYVVNDDRVNNIIFTIKYKPLYAVSNWLVYI